MSESLNKRDNQEHNAQADPGLPVTRTDSDASQPQDTLTRPDGFSEMLLAVTPKASGEFQEVLLARLLNNLPDASEVSAQPTEATRRPTGAGTAKATRTDRAVRSRAATGWLVRLPWLRGLMGTGRGARNTPTRRPVSLVASIAGVALLALLAVGMVALLKARQESLAKPPTSGVPALPAMPGLLTLGSDEMAARMQPILTLPSIGATPVAGPLDSSRLDNTRLGVDTIAWSPDSSRLAVAEIIKSEYQENYVGNNHPLDTYLLHIYNTATGEQLASATLEDIHSVAWSPDSSMLAVGLDRFNLKLYGRDGRELYSLSTPYSQPDQKAANGASWGTFTASPNNSGNVAVAWSPDSHLLASAAGEPFSQTPVLSADGAVRLWDPATGQLVRTIKIATDPSSVFNESGRPLSLGWVTRVQWTPGGHLFLPDGAGVWDAATGQQTEELADLKITTSWPATRYPHVLAAEWSPDGSIFAFADDVFIRLGDPITGQLRRSLPDALPPTPLPTTAPSAPLSQDDVSATFEAGVAQDYYGPVGSFTWSPDSKRIANSNGGGARIWDVATGQRALIIVTPFQTNELAWSPDSKTLAGANGSLTIWDATTGKQLRTVENGTSILAWSPNGTLLAAGAKDGVQLWGVPSDAAPSSTPTQKGSPTTASTPSPGAGATVSPAANAITNDPCGTWNITDSPNVDVGNILQAVAAAAPDDVWAVGSRSSSHVMNEQGWQPVHPDNTLILHWDGSKWADIPSPNVGAGNNSLSGVAAVSRTEAWAVGYYNDGKDNGKSGSPGKSNLDHSLILRWNGTVWNTITIPDVEGLDNRLTAVVAIAQNDVWAVGSYGGSYSWVDPNAPVSKTLIFHWDGKTWTRISSPNPGEYGNRLISVAATATDDVWAVGVLNHRESQPRGGVDTEPLILHWNGRDWTQTPAPGGLNTVAGVAAAARDAAWVIGTESSECCSDARMLRWDGTIWSLEPIPSTQLPADAQPGSVLMAITAISPDDVWAVGNYSNDSESTPSNRNKTLAMHWNGVSWSIVPSPNRETVGSNENIPEYKQQVSQISGLAAISSDDLWAVGYNAVIDDQTLTMVMHYADVDTLCAPTPGVAATMSPVAASTTGEAASTQVLKPATPPAANSPAPPLPMSTPPGCGLTWSQAQMPASTGPDGTNPSPFAGVAAVSANDVWAVGYGLTASANTLTAHWDGSGWRMVDSPNVGTGDNKLYGVAAASANEVWAVGSYSTSSTDSKPLIIHWDGSAWKVVPNLDPGPGLAALHTVAAISPSDVWAVGSYSTGGDPGNTATGPSRTLIEHWDGARWSIVASPSPGNASNVLRSIAAVSSNDIWAVGSYEQRQTEMTGMGKTLALHWDGKEWLQIDSPNVQSWINGLSGVAALAADDVWAVGWTNGGEHVDPLTAHWDGKQWSIVPSPADTSHNGGSLTGIAAISANDIWAVGGGVSAYPSAMHWNGTRWEGVYVPTQSRNGDYLVGGLSGIAAVSSIDIWAVGGLQNGTVSGNATTTFFMRYSNVPCVTPGPAIPIPPTTPSIPITSPAKPNQTVAAKPTPMPVCRTWSLAADINTGAQLSFIASAAAASSDDIWVPGTSGEYPSPYEQSSSQTLLMHWDGAD